MKGIPGISLKKVLWWVGGGGGGGGDIAIIASSSRSRSDFEKDLEVEMFLKTLKFGPEPDLDPLDLDPSLTI